MPKWRWLQPEAEPSEGEFITFRRQMLLFLAGFTFYGSWLLFLWVPETRTATSREMAVAGAALAACGLTLLLRRGWPRLASWVYVIASLLVNSLIYLVFRQTVSLALFAVSTLVAGLLLGPWPCFATGVGATALVIRLQPNPFFSETGPFWLVLIATATGIGVLTGQALGLVDYWERETTLRQKEYIEKLRDRQGELNRTLKALDESYVSLKRANDELVVARQAAEEARMLKEQFVANVSHELRTPLNLITGFAEIMYLAPESYDGVGWTPELESDIREMYRASKHLQSLIEDILDLSRIDAARLPMFRELVDVRLVIGEALETIAPLLKQRRLTHAVQWPDTLPQLFIDRTRIRQVMLNLLNNAVRFTDSGGITICIEQTGEAVVVSVRDTGVGIAADQLEHIFEEFRQAEPGPRSRGGAGLGLAISRRFVELHGGRMWAESQVGVGSVFSFSLPLPGAVPQTTSLYRVPERAHADLPQGPIVVVDPDSSIAAMLARYLGDRRLLPARDAAEAEALVEAEHPVAIVVNQPPDVPLEAWLGPLGPQAQRYNVPVVRCSLPSPSWLQRSTGISECLMKPVSREALQRVLVRYACRQGPVLVVDDDAGFASLMVRMIRTLDSSLEVETAYAGAQALRLARKRRPDLVLLDLLMPEMDGFEVLHRLRNDLGLRGTPIVAVTATSYAEEALRRQGTYLTFALANGIPPGKVTDLLNAMLPLLRPDYAPPAKASSSA